MVRTLGTLDDRSVTGHREDMQRVGASPNDDWRMTAGTPARLKPASEV